MVLSAYIGFNTLYPYPVQNNHNHRRHNRTSEYNVHSVEAWSVSMVTETVMHVSGKLMLDLNRISSLLQRRRPRHLVSQIRQFNRMFRYHLLLKRFYVDENAPKSISAARSSPCMNKRVYNFPPRTLLVFKSADCRWKGEGGVERMRWEGREGNDLSWPLTGAVINVSSGRSTTCSPAWSAHRVAATERQQGASSCEHYSTD